MKAFLIFIVVLCLFLVACGGETNSSETLPDTHKASFRSVCDVKKNIGMWAFTTDDYKQGYGFAIRMTDAEYENECSRYENTVN